MTGFTDIDGQLYVDGTPLSYIAATHGTPAYVYSAAAIRDNIRQLQQAFASALPADRQPLIAFACKANSNIAILRLMRDMGLGADVVSGGEMTRARTAGIAPERIVFSGVAKTDDEIRQAIENGILQINVESAPELDQIARIAETAGKVAHIALRLNPDVDARTHAKITTGKEENKFGMQADQVHALYKTAAEHPHLHPCGISLHIGSQLTDLEPFAHAFEKLAAMVTVLRADGLPVESLDLGGGLGIVYQNESHPDLDRYAALIRDHIVPLGTRIVVEPGRLLVGNAGVLLARATYVKEGRRRRYLILDAGMNDLMRPALYDAWHPIRPIIRAAGDERPCDIVGPVCETGDTFAIQRAMPPMAAGDIVAIMAAGAYGFVMASNYNTRPLPPEILVDGEHIGIIRKRQSVQDILEKECIPDWLTR